MDDLVVEVCLKGAEEPEAGVYLKIIKELGVGVCQRMEGHVRGVYRKQEEEPELGVGLEAEADQNIQGERKVEA